jgi:hypothetical protein
LPLSQPSTQAAAVLVNEQDVVAVKHACARGQLFELFDSAKTVERVSKPLRKYGAFIDLSVLKIFLFDFGRQRELEKAANCFWSSE